MMLYYRGGASGLGMDDDDLDVWIAVTEDRILLESLLVLGDDGNGLGVCVGSVVRRRIETGGRGRRRLRPVGAGEDPTDPSSPEAALSSSSSSTVVVTRAIDYTDIEPPPSLEISFVAIV